MPPDVLLLLSDTTRADAFGPWDERASTPTVDRLCREGTWYRRAMAAAPWTLPSVSSMFSGRLPTEHGISGDSFELVGGAPTSPTHAIAACPGPWLPEALRERGYTTWGVSCNPWVSRWSGFDRGFDRFADLRPWAPRRGGRTGWLLRRAGHMTLQDHGGRRAFDLAAGMVGSSSPGPWFGFVNLMELHAPYDPPPRFHPLLASGATRGPGGPSMLHYQLRQMGFRKRPDRGYLETLRSLYWASARYQDRLLSRFLDMVRERDRPAVVLVVSDHGENLGDHGLFAHHSSLHETLLHVPFLTWGHRVEQFAGAVERPVSVAEASGWILSAVDRNGDGAGPVEGGLPLVSEYESTARHMGLPADLRKRLREGGPDALPRLVNSPGMAVRRDGLKYVATADGEERLFDLSSDPGEMHDVLPGGADQARSFRPLRDAWMKRRDGLRTGPSGERAEDEMAEHLRELGYIE